MTLSTRPVGASRARAVVARRRDLRFVPAKCGYWCSGTGQSSMVNGEGDSIGRLIE